MEEVKHINVNERANSYELGKAGARFKIYYSDIEDLKKQLSELKEAGFLEE
jgi:hypothetical protein